MAKKQRNRRSARQARSQERAEREAIATGVSVEEAKQAQAETVTRPKVEEKKSRRLPGFLRRPAQYLADVRTELQRVSWPDAKEIREYSICVICTLIVLGVVIWLVDTGITAALVVLSGLRS